MSRPDTPPPHVQLMEMLCGAWVAQAISVGASLGIADKLKDGGQHSEALAKACSTNPDSLYRLLRALAGIGILAEDEGRVFRLTPMGEHLRSDHSHSLRAMARFFGYEMNRQPWSDLEQSARTGDQAFTRRFGMGAFDYFARNPDAGQIFSDYMTGLTNGVAGVVASSYDFAGIGTLADIGGSHGILLGTILAAHPEMQGLLCDRPDVLAGAKGMLAGLGVVERVHVVPTDFFAEVPPADAYILKNIIHDWSDELSVQILKNCRRGLAPGGRLLLVEMVVPGPSEPSLAKLVDLEMLVMTDGGRERTAAEYAELLTQAAFQTGQVIGMPSPYSIVETRAAA